MYFLNYSELYIFWFLHQTTTPYLCKHLNALLYIFWFLHQTTTNCMSSISALLLYIFWFLHQTTTTKKCSIFAVCCISFDSYIKPQLCKCFSPCKISCISFDSYIKPQRRLFFCKCFCVVYLLIPTSNHNIGAGIANNIALYIFWFLHQTTTCPFVCPPKPRCISFDSYIKPQLGVNSCIGIGVVYLLIPTSNHNNTANASMFSFVVYLLIPTSNHNHFQTVQQLRIVVYLLIPTSNHNLLSTKTALSLLYIFWFLHQTTTISNGNTLRTSCISFDSYIKPQLMGIMYVVPIVVYLLIPTSNHNLYSVFT